MFATEYVAMDSVAWLDVAVGIVGSTSLLRGINDQKGCRCGLSLQASVAMDVSRTYTQVKNSNVGELNFSFS